MSLLNFRFYIFGLLFFTLIPGRNLHAQKVAVVLSGGGSRGAAHVGVLKALEENGIPIDYIVGTSIGAFVGGLYAAGYSPGEMEKFLTSEEIKRWSTGKPNPEYAILFPKDNPDASWIKIDFSPKKQLSKILPTNVVPTEEMDITLMELFAGASGISEGNFDSLFIPFRCVAADIDSSCAVVLSSGDLASAIRASLTFPFLFKPIRINGRLLFDGGMYNNFPQDVANEVFKADVISGSQVARNYPSPEPDDLLSQIQKMLMTDANFDLSVKNGVLITPNLIRPDLTDFSLAAEFIDSGYVETKRQMKKIRELITTFRDKDSVDRKRELFKQRILPYFIDSLNTEELNKYEAHYLNRLVLQGNSTVTLQDVKQGYYRITHDGFFHVGMPVLSLKENKDKYFLDLNLSKADRFSIKFGGNLSSRVANLGFVELNYKYLFSHGLNLKTNFYFGRFYSSFLLGAKLEYPSLKPFYLGTSIVYNHFDYFSSKIYFLEDLTPSYLIQNENYMSINAGLQVSQKGKIEGEFTYGRAEDRYYQSNNFTREDTADVTRFDFAKTSVKWEKNSLNRKLYATSGARFLIETQFITGKEKFVSGSLTGNPAHHSDFNHDWLRIHAVWDNYFKKIGIFKLGFYGEIMISGQKQFSNYTSSLLSAPAFTHIPESKTIFLPNYRAFNFGVAGLKFIFPITKTIDFRIENYVFQHYRQILQSDEKTVLRGEKFANRYYTGMAALVYNSFLGPVSFSVNYFDNPEDKFFFAFNIGFLIFNQRALD